MPEPSSRWAGAGLARRLATIAVGAPVLIGVLYQGRYLLMAVVLVLVALAAREFERLAAGLGYRPSPVLAGGALAFPVLAATHRWDLAGLATVVIVMAAAGMTLTASRRTGSPGGAAVDTLGALYLGALFAHVILLRDEAGFAVIMTVVAVIWVSDSMAYLVGRTWGRRKLAPAISPGKSVEGFAGGLVSGVIVSVGVAWWQGWPIVAAGAVGLAVVLAGVAGDLWKSTIKRAAGVKDSGSILPGHGGIIDRFDAVLFGVPVGYYLWRWLM
jgi:phosphatidate cytidylyltransferase